MHGCQSVHMVFYEVLGEAPWCMPGYALCLEHNFILVLTIRFKSVKDIIVEQDIYVLIFVNLSILI